MNVFELRNVTRTFKTGTRTVRAVDDLSLDVPRGETLAVIGESGSGKSTLARLMLGLLPVSAGSICFQGREITDMRPKQVRALRSEMQLVFQEPLQSLNPRQTVQAILEEPLRIHRLDMDRHARSDRVAEVLDSVGLPDRLVSVYPAALSGGQQQRVGIARALMTNPSVVVLDEPTSSLDLSVRAQILDLLLGLQADMGLTYVLISHDLSTVEFVSERIAVMYRGRVVEQGPAQTIVQRPIHPYSQLLLSARLSTDPRLAPVPMPDPPVADASADPGIDGRCPFYHRCPQREPVCRDQPVALEACDSDHHVACLLAPRPIKR